MNFICRVRDGIVFMSVMLIFLLLAASGKALASSFQSGQMWLGEFTCNKEPAKQKLGFYVYKIEKKGRKDKVHVFMAFDNLGVGRILFDTFAFVAPKSEVVGFALGRAIYFDSQTNGHRIQGKFSSNGRQFSGEMVDPYCRRGGRFETTLSDKNSSSDLAEMLRVAEKSRRDGVPVWELIAVNEVESGVAGIKENIMYSVVFPADTKEVAKKLQMKFILTKITPTKRPRQFDVEASGVLEQMPGNFGNKVDIKPYRLYGSYNSKTRQLSLVPDPHVRPTLIGVSETADQAFYLRPKSVKGSVSEDGATIAVSYPEYKTPVTFTKTAGSLDLTALQAEAKKAGYRRALQYSREWTAKFAAVVDGDTELQEAVHRANIAPTFTDCVVNIRRKKKADLRIEDVEQCRQTYSSQLNTVLAEVETVRQKREAAEALAKLEKQELWAFKNTFHVAKHYSPAEVERILVKAGAKKTKQRLESPAGFIEVYDTSAVSSDFPVVYVRYIVQRKPVFVSLYLWTQPKVDSINLNAASNAGVLGFLAVGQVAEERRQIENKLLKKFGTPSDINGMKEGDLSKALPTALNALSGATNLRWNRDSGKSYVAYRPYSALPTFLQQSYPKSLYSYRNSTAQMKVLEYSNDLVSKTKINSDGIDNIL